VRSRGARALAAVAFAALVGALGSCSSGVSYVVLELQSADLTPIVDVTDVIVSVSQGTKLMNTLTYHHDPLQIDQVTATTLSVSFSESQLGIVSIVVDARNSTGCTVGIGTANANIKRGGRADVAVALLHDNDCTHADGGAGDAGPRFPGCDPVTPACGPGMTCQVNCDSKMGQCTPGGTGAPGSVCTHNSDCMPGTQCFNYGPTGCPVQLCLRFCDTTSQCAQPGDGGVGPGSVCEGPVQCGATLTGYHTCTFSCDPRQVAVGAAANGCPTGLACLALGTMDEVDCACPEATRTKQAGEDCLRTTDCVPGLLCNLMGGTEKCRPICRCDAQGSACTASAGDCPSGTACTPLTNNRIYGVCL
jgi:hypothetical protein